MPAGVASGPVHCRRCNDLEFPTFSDLRKHQWSVHAKTYKNIYKKQKWSKEQHAKFKATMAAKNGNSNSVRAFLKGAANMGAANMSAQDVLQRLRDQRDFMNDIVDLVEGMIK